MTTINLPTAEGRVAPYTIRNAPLPAAMDTAQRGLRRSED
jgi:hypothetical protein